MTRWPKITMIGVSAFLLVLTGSVTAAQADRLTPADAEAVVQINVRQILQAPLVKKHALDPLKVALKHNDEVQQLLTAAGIDPLKDIDTISVSTSGNPTAGGKLLAVVRGNFDPDKAAKAAEDHAKKHPGQLKSFKEGELAMWEITSDNKSFYAAFADKNTLVMTASKEDTTAIVGRAGQPAQGLRKDMQAALEQIKGDEKVWMAVVATEEIKQFLKKDDNAKDFATALQSMTGGLELTDDAQLSLVVHTSSPAAARQIKGKLDELMPFLAFLGAGRDKSGQIAKEVIDSIKLNTDKSDVSIRVKITDAQIEKAHKKDR